MAKRKKKISDTDMFCDPLPPVIKVRESKSFPQLMAEALDPTTTNSTFEKNVMARLDKIIRMLNMDRRGD